MSFFKLHKGEIKVVNEGIVDCFSQTFELTPPNKFEKWCLEATLHFKHEFLSDKPHKRKTGEDAFLQGKEFVDEVLSKSEKHILKLVIGKEVLRGDLILDFSKISFEKSIHISMLSYSNNDSRITIKGALIGAVDISECKMGITFEDCYIKQLGSNRQFSKVNIKLLNCMVGKLITHTSSTIGNLTVKSGWICSVDCPDPLADNPFIGSITFSDVSFPTSEKPGGLFKGPQQYRNLRAHFEKLNNVHAASLMRAKELASEREIDSGVSWWFNWLYYLASKYGLSPGRPLWMIFILYFMTTYFIYGWDGGAIRSENKTLVGWESSLAEMNELGRLKRSMILPVQSTFNPFGAFRTNQIIVPVTGWGKTLLILNGFLSDGLFLFLIFAVRKRFKLS